MSFSTLALQNLLSPLMLYFALRSALAFVRSDLSIPGAVAKLLSLYLMMSIGSSLRPYRLSSACRRVGPPS